MKESIDKIYLLNHIAKLEQEKKVLRRVNLSDLKTNKKEKQKKGKQEKVKGYRKQEEHGEKKFIKPWRTSTKSQQQPPKSGKKAGGRGVQRV